MNFGGEATAIEIKGNETSFSGERYRVNKEMRCYRKWDVILEGGIEYRISKGYPNELYFKISSNPGNVESPF